MLFSEIEQEVKNIIQDSSFDEFVPGYINEAFLQVSSVINLPDLKRIGVATTSTGQMYTSIAGIQDGFNGRLELVITPGIQRCKNAEELLNYATLNRREITEEGPVEVVALEGRTLWYFPTPATEQSIQCLLYVNPPLLEDQDDVPTFIPDICHRNIGIHGAVFFASIVSENGVEGEKVDSNYNYTMFTKGIAQIQEWVGKNRVHTICNTYNDSVPSTNQLRWPYAK